MNFVLLKTCLKSIYFGIIRYIYYEYLCLKIMTAAKRPKFYFNNFNEYKRILCFLAIFCILVVK